MVNLRKILFTFTQNLLTIQKFFGMIYSRNERIPLTFHTPFKSERLEVADAGVRAASEEGHHAITDVRSRADAFGRSGLVATDAHLACFP
jgi:hypothetical protein